ncbi:hypothetical protein [Haladaptatus cibarius]|uniref:hypothetical protein n=1 Tax=Haladaptatus cibarius TaxID=453847 RepID=UPI000B075165|nr:hypothetical protein [Haladaptatus cibarius]
MNLTLTVLALLTGVITGGLFHSLGVPIPARQNSPASSASTSDTSSSKRWGGPSIY